MLQSKIKLPALNADGSEKVDRTPVAMPVSRFQSTNDMDIKLKQMVQAALADREPMSQEEILGEELDWEIPDDRPQNRFKDRMPTREELRNVYKKFKKQKQAASEDDADPADIPKGRNVKPGRKVAGKNKLAKDHSEQSESDDSDE